MPTPAGWTRLGDLRLGDTVFDEAGKPCRVLAVYDSMPARAYRLTFSDGTHIDAGGEHQWVTWSRQARKAYLRSRHEADITRMPPDWPNWRPMRQPSGHAGRNKPAMRADDGPGPRIVMTDDIVDSIATGKRGDLNHSIPVCGALDLPDVALPFDPWAFGYWLGNGTAKHPEVTCHGDDEAYVLGRIGAHGKVGHDPRANCFRVRADIFREMPAIGKVVPPAYLRASTAQRLDLLRGLMDSDGHCGASRNTVEFCSTVKALADLVVELARSLGQKPVLAEGRATLNGKDCGPKWRVTWRPTIQVFGSPRKAARWRTAMVSQGFRHHHRMIVDAEPIPLKPMRCITVDSPNSMYLLGDGMIPTHNTRSGAEDVVDYCIWNDGARVAVVAPTLGDLRKTIFMGDSGLISVIPPQCYRGGSVSTGLNISLHEIHFWNGSKIEGFSSEEPDRLRGPQFHRAWCLSKNTLVLMADRTNKPIDRVRAGDWVATRTGCARVAAAGMTNPAAPVMRVTTSCGRSIVGTTNHLVYVLGQGFTPIVNLHEGDVLCAAGEDSPPVDQTRDSARGPAPSPHTGIVLSVEGCPTPEPVYDLEIEGAHEFFANGILVHNCDELAAWKRLQETWDMLMFGLRLGQHPQVLVTTTPRPLKLLKELIADAKSKISKSSTFANKANLAPSYFERIRRTYEGTRLGRQELYAEVLEDTPGALWSLKLIEQHRRRIIDAPQFQRIVVAIDPSVSNNPGSDETGIVVAAKGVDGHGYVLHDASLRGLPISDDPKEPGWCDVAVEHYKKFFADRIIGEVNNGGALIEATLRAVDKNVSYKAVTASRGKAIRAEPISALYQRGLVHHVGGFPTLEDQMCAFTSDFDRDSAGYSPDRMDALVWALTELFIDDTGNAGILEYYRALSQQKK